VLAAHIAALVDRDALAAMEDLDDSRGGANLVIDGTGKKQQSFTDG
jgi:hypothetical protein